eukprot:347605-Chlamydomonas_euryale.AAC.3
MDLHMINEGCVAPKAYQSRRRRQCLKASYTLVANQILRKIQKNNQNDFWQDETTENPHHTHNHHHHTHAVLTVSRLRMCASLELLNMSGCGRLASPPTGLASLRQLYASRCAALESVGPLSGCSRLVHLELR